jgi:plastocyanin
MSQIVTSQAVVRWAITAGLLALALGLAGCGDGEDDGDAPEQRSPVETLTEAEYFQTLDELDRATDDSLGEVFGPGGAASARTRMEALAAVLLDSGQELSSLAPPQAASTQHEELEAASADSSGAVSALAEGTPSATGEQALELLLLQDEATRQELLRLNAAYCELEELAVELGQVIELECEAALPAFIGAALGEPDNPAAEAVVSVVEGEDLFDVRALFVRAGEDVAVKFVNRDAPTPHDLSFSATTPLDEVDAYIAQTPVIQFEDPPEENLTFSVASPGVYYFSCSLHPKPMNGVVLAVE